MSSPSSTTSVDRPTSGFENVLFSPLSDHGGAAAVRRLLPVMADGASLTMLSVVREPTRFEQLLHEPEHIERILEEEHSVAMRRLGRCERAVERAEADVEVAAMVDVGHPGLTLVSHAVAARHDLLVVATDRDEHQALIRRLLRKAPCPVWVLRPSRAATHRVLAAVDPEPDEEPLSRAVLTTAARLAGPDGEVHVVHAWELFGEATMRSSAFMQLEPDEVDRRRRAVGEAHERAVHELVARCEGCVDWSVEVIAGPAIPVIEATVARLHIGTVVLGSTARSGISGAVMGNTAERLVDEVRCSIAVVKPPGFVSPIR